MVAPLIVDSVARFAVANLTALFASHLSPDAEIIVPTDAAWKNDLQQRWSDYRAPTYFGAIKPANEEDGQVIVKIAQENAIPFLATGGGHSFSDYSRFDGLSIDLGKLNSTKLDAETNTVSVGGSAKYHQLHDLLYDVGKELPLASCACPGIIGSTLGLGPLQGHRGLMIDALESLRVVTANGTIVMASETDEKDLFWAMRGAGSNFGIVTSAKFKVHDITNEGQAMFTQLLFPASANLSYFKVLEQMDRNMPSRLALTNLRFYDRTVNQSFVGLNAIYFGTEEEGTAALKPFIDLNPINNTILTGPQSKLFPPILGSCDPNQHINIYSHAIKRTEPETLSWAFGEFNKFWEKYKGYQGRLLIQRFANDAIRKVGDKDTAYPWRDAVAHISIEGDKLVEKSGYSQLAAYSNFARITEDPASWFSKVKLRRLSALKKHWDPNGLFNYDKPIPTDKG
ncbi:hypothetical protein NLG97_g6851 [Lecanicillium saksenae]|uniref:Uncharacterized protein n=1 Tax=Lecanicillium saksenae TaxID=468837 RepID=A0ACC1QQ27_9HYPO|nr:hypothetical protein NLG97_g6851 [Lecanicillium saksenae]